MISYKELKEKGELEVKKGSADCWMAGEMMGALGVDTDKSNFTFSRIGLDTCLETGYVTLKTGQKITVIK